MAIAVTQGHVQRAIEFYNKPGKYFIIGGEDAPWTEEGDPTPPNVDDYKLIDVTGLKKVDNCYLIIPDDENGTIEYRNAKWRIVPPPFKIPIAPGIGVLAGGDQITLSSLENINKNMKLRVNSTYEGIVKDIDYSTNTITLDTPATDAISAGSIVEGGALVEGAKYIYVDCALRHSQFPLVTYRQIGVCTEVTSSSTDLDILRSAKHSSSKQDEYTSLGVLEIIDNRSPSKRSNDQIEELSLIIEF